MNATTHIPIRQVALGFGAGALSMALLTIAGTALAQAPAEVDLQQMLQWCTQMMSQAGSTMQGMMSGMCMMGR